MKNKKIKINKQAIMLMIMMLPGIVYLLINNYAPMVGIVLAFKKYNYAKGMWQSPWTGLSNFTYLFKTKDAFIMIRNTLLYNLVFIILGTIMSVGVAIILNEIKNKLAKKIYQTVILIPYLISMIVVSYITFAFLSTNSGLINNMILGGSDINWYAKSEAWPLILTIVYLWKNFGYMSIIYYATIIGIDESLYEAAIVDGASRFKRMIHVTLPGVKYTVITMVLLSIGKIFRSDFGLFFQVPQNSGILSDVTTTIDVYVYKGLTQLNDIGRASAAGFIQAVFGFILVLLANYIVNKIDKESALF
ncbi:ABC transporter permease [Clostridium grantii]|uniref:ABC transporter permease n=1 Tax=Clostridium grantii TaxID=40575 RepID=UPI001FA8895F|nr:ABC transporter permease subunit [Clostridium grantii]